MSSKYVEYQKKQEKRIIEQLKDKNLTSEQKKSLERELKGVQLVTGTKKPEEVFKITPSKPSKSTPTIYVTRTPEGVKKTVFGEDVGGIVTITDKSGKFTRVPVSKGVMTKLTQYAQTKKTESSRFGKGFEEAMLNDMFGVSTAPKPKGKVQTRETYVPEKQFRMKTPDEILMEEQERKSELSFARSEWQRLGTPEKIFMVATMPLSKEGLEALSEPKIDYGIRDLLRGQENIDDTNWMYERIIRVGNQKAQEKTFSDRFIKNALSEGLQNPMTMAVLTALEGQVLEEIVKAMPKGKAGKVSFEAEYLKEIDVKEAGIKGGKLPKDFDPELLIKSGRDSYEYGSKVDLKTYTKIVEKLPEEKPMILKGKTFIAYGKEEMAIIRTMEDLEMSLDELKVGDLTFRYNKYMRQKAIGSMESLKESPKGFRFVRAERWLPVEKPTGLNLDEALFVKAKDITELKPIKPFAGLKDTVVKESLKTKDMLVSVKELTPSISESKIKSPVLSVSGLATKEYPLTSTKYPSPRLKQELEYEEIMISPVVQKMMRVENQKQSNTIKTENISMSLVGQALSPKTIQREMTLQTSKLSYGQALRSIEIVDLTQGLGLEIPQMQQSITTARMPEIKIERPNLRIRTPKIDVPIASIGFGFSAENIKLDFGNLTTDTIKIPEMKSFYTPSYYGIAFDIEKEMKDVNKTLSSGFGIRPIPKKRRRKK